MVIYPKLVNPKTSNQEKFVFKLISEANLGEGYYAYHSLLLPDHRHKFVGETDFLILTPEGFLLLEVKGGIVAIDEHGNWTTTTKKQKVKPLEESPFHQAEGNMYSVSDELENASLPFVYRKNLSGYGVIFPDCKFDLRTIETGRSLVLDETSLCEDNAIAKFIKNLEKYWKAKIRGVRAFTPEQQQRIRHWLRPQFHAVTSLRSEFLHLEDQMVGLLEDQMDFLAIGSDEDRTICRGGAGTGKTLVGLELARQHLLQDEKVYYVVPNEILKGYLNSRGHKSSWIVTIDELSELSDDKADVIIVDEAQDIMSYPRIESIDKVLKGGIDSGKWAFFMDEQNQKGVDGVFEEECYQHIVELADRDFKLPRNIRNTMEIIAETKKLTSRDIGRKGTGRGTTKYFEYKTDDERGKKINDRLALMTGRDLTPDMVVIIGKGPMATNNLVASLIKYGHKFFELDKNNSTFYPFTSERRITYSSAKNFKGIEAYIVIVDIGDFGTEALSSPEFYVAITRAVGHLIILYPRSMRKEIAALETKNIAEIKLKEGESNG